MATHNLPVGVVGQGCHNFQPALLKLSAVVADVLRDVLPWQEPVEFPSEFQAERSNNNFSTSCIDRFFKKNWEDCVVYNYIVRIYKLLKWRYLD